MYIIPNDYFVSVAFIFNIAFKFCRIHWKSVVFESHKLFPQDFLILFEIDEMKLGTTNVSRLYVKLIFIMFAFLKSVILMY